MSSDPIRFFNRYSGQLETEKVYGEKWLRWVYETGPGRMSLEWLLKRAVFSRWYGRKMDRPISAQKILPFIIDYDLDVDDFAKRPLTFKTFNEFFYRALKPVARPIKDDPKTVVFPADGRHLAFPDVEKSEGFYVKGMKFSLRDLLKDEALAARYCKGTMIISRLCPVDYHRFHFPVAGVAAKPVRIEGDLYSVSPIALRRQVRYLVENKRELTCIETLNHGTILMLEVGATCVGTIRQTYVENTRVSKGAEKGYFTFGGSCVITLFEPGRVRLAEDLVKWSAENIETYARMGDELGTWVD